MAEPREERTTGREPLLERPRLREGYPFPDMNSYVVALKNRLHIPEERFQELRRTRGVKLEGWMSAVQPIEDDRPPVRAKIGSRGVLLNSDMKLPDRITENTPVLQVIQTDALYLAKLKYLKEAAPQATSWGRGRTKEKQVKQQIAELTSKSIVAGGKIDRISFKKALVSLDKKKIPPALATATFALASCTGGPKPIEPSPAEPVVTEVAPIFTIEPTLTKEAPPTPVTIASGKPYPESDADFFLGAGGPENAEERLRELGAGPDIDKIWAMGVAEMERSGINPENIEWVTELNELAENPSWTIMPRDKSTGHFLFPKITSGPEAGQLVRSGSIFAYLDREIGENFFDWIELQDPEGVGEVEQRLIGDESGWIVVGAFNAEGEMLFWFNAEKDEWIPASDYSPEPSPTVEPTLTPEIKVSDITDEVRIFTTTTVIGERKLLPFGISEHQRIVVREGYRGYILSGVLLEKPYYDENNFVVFRLGIPDFSQGKFREFYFRDPIDANLEAELLHAIRPSIRNIADGGFDLLGGNLKGYPLEEAMELYEKSIGRQIALVLEVGTTEAHELEHLEWILGRYDPWAVPSSHAYGLLISQAHENYKVFTYLLNGNPAYEGKEFGMVMSYSHVPWSSADWK